MDTMFIFVFAIFTISEVNLSLGFTVKGLSGPLVVPLGGSVLLPCSVHSLLSMEDLEVEWSKSQTLVHLYQDGDIRPEAQHQSFNDRANFFTDNIKHGNFSLLLKNVTAQDEGQYTCTVYSGRESHETVVEIKDVERLTVSGSDQSISVYVGDDVTLNCSVDSHIPPKDIEEVSWKKRVGNEYITILLYQNNTIHPESSDERYRDRVEFFTDEIHRGNFSLRLKRVRTEDKGVYVCQVFAGQFSDSTTGILEQLGLSGSHIMVLILCISACGSALLFCSLIYCRPNNTVFTVEGSYGAVPLGDSAVLPCFIDRHLVTKDLDVEWRRSDSQILIHMYHDGNIGPEVQHEDYHERACFFTDDIKQGNFSLLLKNVTTDDLGQYTCKVFRQQRPVMSVRVDLNLYGVGFIIKYSCDLVVPLGGSVLLPCSVESLLPMEDLEVEWSKSGLQKPVFVYQDGDIRPEVQHEDYHERACFFTDDIIHGNFSLLLKNVTTKDEGEYTCKVYTQTTMFSVTTKLLVRQLDSVFRLQMFLVFCPNIIMFFAFVFWGVSEGSVNETVCCCALYIVRPLMLLWAASYIFEFKGKIKSLVMEYSCVAEYFVLTAVVYSALFTNTWEKLLNYAEFERVLVLLLYIVMILCCLGKSIYILAAQIGIRCGRTIKMFDIVADLTFEILPTLQFILLFYTFGSARAGLIIVSVLPLLLTLTNERMFYKCDYHFSWSVSVIRTVWLIVTLVVNAVMIGLYIITLEYKTDAVGWACVMVFLQILWTVVRFSDQSYYFSIARDFHRFVSLYVFGSVGVVVISAVALMTELILKTVNGERAVMDLRCILYPSECFFIMSLMISGQLAPKIILALFLILCLVLFYIYIYIYPDQCQLKSNYTITTQKQNLIAVINSADLLRTSA
ncbi:hypothetical protein IRJ41_022598 [Triplophysa rosa]|uniref:Ig-like domain-containing protein n=1 Tax=Triplophysa rosa TaxID=992332 RepID=A0A9W7X1K4_TRIRA|nr:hypothetical protein IRJ41_022598 [Triplophysa rosa]